MSEVFVKDGSTSVSTVNKPPLKRPREDSEEVLEMREEVRQLRGEICGIDGKLEGVLDAVGNLIQEIEGMRMTVGKILRCSEGHEARLKSIETTLNKHTEEMTELKGSVKTFDARIGKLEVNMTDINQTVKKVDGLERKLKQMEKKERDLEWRGIENEARSRRNNLLFYGIPESEGEDCDDVIRNIIHSNLRLNPTGLIIQRAHRLRTRKPKNSIGQSSTRPRPIIANFLNFSDKEKIRSLHHKLPRPLGVSDDLPLDIRKARESLLPELKELKNRGKKASIAYPARLIADGKVVKDLDIIEYKYR